MEVLEYSSRTVQLISDLERLQFPVAKRALDLVMKEMCVEKGYKRHDKTHYYHHLVDVAQICINLHIKNNKNEDLITAALLHDLVEDVPGYTNEKVSLLFNKRVAQIVELLTKKKGVDYQNPQNTQIYLLSILEDEDATIIKTADRMHNFGTLRFASFDKKVRQAKETEKLFIPFFKEARIKYPTHSSFFFLAKTIIEPHLSEIMEHQETHIENSRLKREINKLKNKD